MICFYNKLTIRRHHLHAVPNLMHDRELTFGWDCGDPPIISITASHPIPTTPTCPPVRLVIGDWLYGHFQRNAVQGPVQQYDSATHLEPAACHLSTLPHPSIPVMSRPPPRDHLGSPSLTLSPEITTISSTPSLLFRV